MKLREEREKQDKMFIATNLVTPRYPNIMQRQKIKFLSSHL